MGEDGIPYNNSCDFFTQSLKLVARHLVIIYQNEVKEDMTTAEDLGAILQRDRQSYAIVPRTPAGIISPENLENIVKVARRYEISVIKMTSGQRMVNLRRRFKHPLFPNVPSS